MTRVWIIEREYLVSHTFVPLAGALYPTEAKAKEAISKLPHPEFYIASEYRKHRIPLT